MIFPLFLSPANKVIDFLGQWPFKLSGVGSYSWNEGNLTLLLNSNLYKACEFKTA